MAVCVSGRGDDCSAWKGQNRGCQSSPGHGSGQGIFCDPFRSYRSDTIPPFFFFFYSPLFSSIPNAAGSTVLARVSVFTFMDQVLWTDLLDFRSWHASLARALIDSRLFFGCSMIMELQGRSSWSGRVSGTWKDEGECAEVWKDSGMIRGVVFRLG